LKRARGREDQLTVRSLQARLSETLPLACSDDGEIQQGNQNFWKRCAQYLATTQSFAMSSLAEKLRAAALSEQRQSNDQSTQQYGIAEQRKTIASHHNDNPPRPSIAEKLRAAVVIATPRQNELENSYRAVAKNDEP
jgi:hypothetical protein